MVAVNRTRALGTHDGRKHSEILSEYGGSFARGSLSVRCVFAFVLAQVPSHPNRLEYGAGTAVTASAGGNTRSLCEVL